MPEQPSVRQQASQKPDGMLEPRFDLLAIVLIVVSEDANCILTLLLACPVRRLRNEPDEKYLDDQLEYLDRRGGEDLRDASQEPAFT